MSANNDESPAPAASQGGVSLCRPVGYIGPPPPPPLQYAPHEQFERQLCWPLGRPADLDHLSELTCYVRCQLEVFVATPFDLSTRTERACLHQGVSVGSVGLRCVYCTEAQRQDVIPQGALLARQRRARGAVIFPGKIRMIHEAVRNWQSRHFKKCEEIPESVRAEFQRLRKEGRRRRRNKMEKDAGVYWEESFRRMGMIDTENGVRLRPGAPFLGGGGFGEALFNGKAGGGAGKRAKAGAADDAPEQRKAAKKKKVLPLLTSAAQHPGSGERHRVFPPRGPPIDMDAQLDMAAHQIKTGGATAANAAPIALPRMPAGHAQRSLELAKECVQKQVEHELNADFGSLPVPALASQDSFSSVLGVPPPKQWLQPSENDEYEYRMKLVVMPMAVLQKKQKGQPASSSLPPLPLSLPRLPLPPQSPNIVLPPTSNMMMAGKPFFMDLPTERQEKTAAADADANNGDSKLSLLVRAMDCMADM
mmetsp:Transcript_21924/g.64739  ORF Transcript_21924/g.64739 Transcript_21924/m.64739 type:complete len:478 (-) Transcript_21924:295-1728(-)